MTQRVRQAMWSAALAGAAAIFLLPAASLAQSGTAGNPNDAVDSTLYVEAFKMVSNGNPEDGRELVDSLLRASKEGSPQYVEGLYWRARLASMGPKAEQDYRRIIVDYSMNRRAPDALIRLGQLELARGDRDPAAQHFQRAIRDYPNSPSYATANYWLARTYFESNKIERACIASAEAVASADPTDVELKNRIEYQNQQCRGVTLKVPTQDDGTKSEVKGKEVAHDADSVVVDSAEAVAANDTDAAEAEDTTDATAAEPTKSKSGKSIPVLGTTADAAASTSASKSKRAYMVQIAAFRTKSQADKLAAGLKEKGYSVHVDGKAAPYRVRIGHFATRAAAEAMLVKLRAKQIDGFITQG